MKAIDEIEKFVTKEANHWKEKMNNKTGFDLVEASARFSECSTILAMITGLRNTLNEGRDTKQNQSFGIHDMSFMVDFEQCDF